MAVPISNVTRRVVFAPSGTGPYAFTFEILAATDIEVYKGDTLLTLTTDYTVTINVNGTGSVTLVATAGTDNITIVGARAIERTTDFVTGGDFFANTVNSELDSLTIFAQQNAEAVTRSIQAPVTDPTTIDMTLPVKATRAGKYLSFNASTGDPEVVNTVVDVTTVAGIAADVTKVAGISSNVTTVAGVSANVTTVAGISSNVSTVAGISGNVTTVAGISADVTAVAGDATDIGTVAGLSTEIAALGPISADITAVAAVDTDVTTLAAVDSDIAALGPISSDITAVSSISANVTTVAGISSDVTTVATNVADITNFSDVYLGPKSSDPATRNDSSALQAGDLYFDTVNDVMKVYDGAAWVAAYVSLSGALVAANNLSDLTDASAARQNLDLEIGVDVQAYDSTIVVDADIGVTVQAYDADTAKLDVAQSFTAQQTFKELKDTVHTISDGAGFEIDPANGSIQVVTLGANRTPAATNFEAGQMVLLGIDDGTDYLITWTTVGVTWVKAGGTAEAPTLAASGYTWVLLWKVASTIYGTEVGQP